MKCIRALLLILAISLGMNVLAQDGVGIGNWRTHMPYQSVIGVEILGSRVYAATEYELFTYDKEDNSLRILNKINLLSDLGISKIRHNDPLDLLVVAYSNANIDLIDKQGNVVNMSDIKDKSILGNKSINNITFKGELAYFSCGFGIVVFDLKKQEVKDTYYIGNNGNALNVKDVAFYNGKIYAATEDGLYVADENSETLADFSSWSFDASPIHPHMEYSELETFGGKLLANYVSEPYDGDTLYVFDGQQWSHFDPTFTSDKRELRVSGDKLLVSCFNGVKVFDKAFQSVEFIYNNDKGIRPNVAMLDTDGTYWIGDRNLGLIQAKDSWHMEVIQPNGPYSKNVFALSTYGKHVWISTGGHYSNWSKFYAKEGVCHFDGQWWNNINRKNDAFLDELNVSDFVCTATDPMDTTVTYVGTWGYGLLKYKNDQFVERLDHNTPGCTLEPWVQDERYVLISGLAFDSHGNLWVANSGANNLLSVMDREGNWRSYNMGGVNIGVDISVLMIDHNDYKWIIRRLGSDDKVIVFNENATGQKVKTLRCVAGQGGISGSNVNCFAVDRNGYVWLGTDSGPCYFADTKKIFSENRYDANVVLVPRNDGTGQADPLFNEISVLSIAVDGNNNKWFGLETGVFEMSADCKTQLLNFNTDNSPLPSNAVSSMAINEDGEVFLGTELGLISYRGSATPGGSTNSDVVVYPNPVRPGYNGYVGIKGLVEDALVRITTVDGVFVTELIAEGGQAVWDCTALDGQKVLPGIYLVFVSTREGEQRFATKILIMN